MQTNKSEARTALDFAISQGYVTVIKTEGEEDLFQLTRSGGDRLEELLRKRFEEEVLEETVLTEQEYETIYTEFCQEMIAAYDGPLVALLHMEYVSYNNQAVH